ncbi:MAG: HK97 family phage prohead protease [Pseudomonadota bacterium]
MKQIISREEFVIKSAAKDNMVVSGYASVFGVVDSHNDIIMRSAFGDASQKINIKFLWQHDQSKPIGVITSLMEDDYGLYVEGSINGSTQQGREAIALIEQGALNGLSVGFMTKDSGYNEGGSREIIKADLYEISLVTFPANTEAGISKISSALDKAASALERITGAHF